MRREAQLAAQRYEEERQRARGVQREPVRSYVKVHKRLAELLYKKLTLLTVACFVPNTGGKKSNDLGTCLQTSPH